MTPPTIGKRAATLLEQAPVKQIGPGIIPPLTSQPWATEVLKSWWENSELSKSARNAIGSALGKGV